MRATSCGQLAGQRFDEKRTDVVRAATGSNSAAAKTIMQKVAKAYSDG